MDYDATKYYARNLLKVELFYEEFNYKIISEVAAYEVGGVGKSMVVVVGNLWWWWELYGGDRIFIVKVRFLWWR